MRKKVSETWLFIAAYVAVIYVTLPVMRHVLGFFYSLIGRAALGYSISVIITAFTLYVFVLLSRKGRMFQMFQAFLLLAVTLTLVFYVKRPEERIHFLEYGVLGFVVIKAGRGALFALVFATVIGGVDELIQHFLPNRVGDWRDVLMNAVGGALGVWAGRLWFLRRRLVKPPI